MYMIVYKLKGVVNLSLWSFGNWMKKNIEKLKY